MRCWLWMAFSVGLAACTKGPSPRPDGGGPGTFAAPQAIAVSDRFVLVGNTAFHYEGTRPAYGSAFVSVVDRQLRRVVGQVPTSAANTQAIEVRGSTAYVVNSGRLAIDSRGLATVEQPGALDRLELGAGVPATMAASLPLGRSAADPRIGAYGAFALSPDGRTAWIGSGTRGDVFKVDLAGWRVLRGAENPLELFATPPGTNGMTTVRPWGQGIAVLDYNSDQLCVSEDLTGDLARRSCGPVGVHADLVEGPIDLARAPDGRALVLMTVANSVYRVNVGATPFAAEAGWVKTGLSSNRVIVRGEYAYVVNSLSHNLQRIHLATGRSELPFAVFPVGSNPYDLAITEEGGQLVGWVTLFGSHQLALVDLGTGKLLSLLGGAASTRDGGVDGATRDGGPDGRGGDGAPRDGAADTRPNCGDAGAQPVVGIGSVVRVTYGAGAGLGQSQLPGVIQGGPGGGGAGGGSTGEVLSLGEGGEIVVDFGAYDIEDGPGADFIVYENPFLLSPFTPNAEPAQVAVSESGTAPTDFKEFPCDLSRTRGDAGKQEWPYPGCAGVRPVLANVKENCLSPADPVAGGGDAFDLATVGLKRARYVRLRDAGKAALGTNSRGFDLDAVVIVHPVKR